MENYIIAAAIATIAPGLVVKACGAVMSGGWYLGNRLVYGKSKSQEEIQMDIVSQIKKDMEERFEERIIDIQNRERNIELKLEKILKLNYASGDGCDHGVYDNCDN